MPAVVVALCREGFESEAAADLAGIARVARLPVRCEFAPRGARVVAQIDGNDVDAWRRAATRSAPVFLRVQFAGTGPHAIADPDAKRPDRVAALVAAFEDLARRDGHEPPWLAPWIEFPDTNDGKALSTLARALEPRLAAALRERGLVGDAAALRAQVSLIDGRRAWVGTSDRASGSAWPSGVARLSMPREAPSRSTLKLAEAIAVFLGPREAELLHAGQSAVDLGAAPGGWTWQLLSRGLQVVAVDRGALAPSLERHIDVEHLRVDGFAFRPRRPVDWLVCDMVEQPSRIAALVADWIATGAASNSIFNLKLPMKRRHDEVMRCAASMRERLARAGLDVAPVFRQLYHDREEVTGYLAAPARVFTRRR
jgi:23S rRNA (cytidine2498-2'-O)-methyltransferase